jgi:hypothetical protein
MTTRESRGRVNTRWAACRVAGALLALTSCTAVKVKLGMRVYLANTPVSSMQASLPMVRPSPRERSRR